MYLSTTLKTSDIVTTTEEEINEHYLQYYIKHYTTSPINRV